MERALFRFLFLWVFFQKNQINSGQPSYINTVLLDSISAWVGILVLSLYHLRLGPISGNGELILNYHYSESSHKIKLYSSSSCLANPFSSVLNLCFAEVSLSLVVRTSEVQRISMICIVSSISFVVKSINNKQEV